MTRKVLSIIIALILIGVVVGVIIISDFNDNYSDFVPLTSVSGIVESSNDFAFNIYKELSTGNDNVFFSPYSITTALGMAYEGARGQTAQEMAEVLGIPEDDQTRWDLMWSYQGYFNHGSRYYDLSTANAYWLAEDADLREQYRTVLESYYWAHGEELDFAGDPEGSAETINDWVEDKTNNKIENMIDPNSIVPYTYLMLTNAIYFKSDWKYKFDPRQTCEDIFILSDGTELQTDMMYMPNDYETEFNCSHNSETRMLELPYKNGELAMYILLPFYDVEIGTLEQNLTQQYISELKGNMTLGTMDIKIPKFKFELNYNLNQALINLGMPTAFSTDADFTGITDSTSLYINNVEHQSFVEVNEEGTEAAAATVVSMMMCAGNMFFANHPFIFFIEHKDTGQILFMGKLENPQG